MRPCMCAILARARARARARTRARARAGARAEARTEEKEARPAAERPLRAQQPCRGPVVAGTNGIRCKAQHAERFL